MVDLFTTTRQIGIDAAHRVPDHASKCKSIHGHRYTIEVTVEGRLAESGSSNGMTLDFGFLKAVMMKYIDAPCDHGLILYFRDPLLHYAIVPKHATGAGNAIFPHLIESAIKQQGFVQAEWDGGKLYVVNTVPTAENLARHWFMRLERVVKIESRSRAWLKSVRVWETPNCYAEFVGRVEQRVFRPEEDSAAAAGASTVNADPAPDSATDRSSRMVLPTAQTTRKRSLGSVADKVDSVTCARLALVRARRAGWKHSTQGTGPHVGTVTVRTRSKGTKQDVEEVMGDGYEVLEIADGIFTVMHKGSIAL